MDKTRIKPRISVGKHMVFFKYICHIEYQDYEVCSYAERNAFGVGMTMREAYEAWGNNLEAIDERLIATDSILKREKT